VHKSIYYKLHAAEFTTAPVHTGHDKKFKLLRTPWWWVIEARNI